MQLAEGCPRTASSNGAMMISTRSSLRAKESEGRPDVGRSYRWPHKAVGDLRAMDSGRTRRDRADEDIVDPWLSRECREIA
jgi:hypothetical protein